MAGPSANNGCGLEQRNQEMRQASSLGAENQMYSAFAFASGKAMCAQHSVARQSKRRAHHCSKKALGGIRSRGILNSSMKSLSIIRSKQVYTPLASFRLWHLHVSLISALRGGEVTTMSWAGQHGPTEALYFSTLLALARWKSNHTSLVQSNSDVRSGPDPAVAEQLRL